MPQTEEEILQAMIEGLTSTHAAETFAGTNAVKCALCEARVVTAGRSFPAVQHGPYCPVALARRLRALREGE
jgi:hypothetical protein